MARTVPPPETAKHPKTPFFLTFNRVILWERNDVWLSRNGALKWNDGFWWFFLQFICHLWINMWTKLQLQILKNHLEFDLVFPSKDPCTSSSLTQHQILRQWRLSILFWFHKLFSLKLSLTLTYFWILWSHLTIKKFNWNQVQFISWLNVLRINSSIKSILIISRIFSHCLNSCLMHNSDLVKNHFILTKFHLSKYLTY